jgi:hypothetical protein
MVPWVHIDLKSDAMLLLVCLSMYHIDGCTVKKEVIL